MKFAYIYIFCAFTQMGLSQAEDLDFFEKKYESIISGVKPIGEYSDPDSYYTAIASKLGIFGKAYYAVFQKFGWSKGPNKTHSAKLTRAEGAGRVGVRQPDAPGGQPVEVGRLVKGAPEAPEVARAQVVGEDQEDVEHEDVDQAKKALKDYKLEVVYSF